MLLKIVLIIFLDCMAKYLKQNRKRLAAAGLAVLVFFVSSSFSAPSFQNQQTANMVQAEEKQSADLAQEQGQLSDEGGELLLTETGGNDHSGNDAKYSAEEILGDSHSQKLLKQNTGTVGTEGFSKDDWNLILVNKQHPVPEDYTFEMGTITANMKCDARILPELFAMLQAAKEDGVNLIVCSPYRDISLQNVLFERKINLYMGQGDNYMEAYKKASQIVTVPGASEHQIGLALDIICDTYTILDEGFGKTAAGQWLWEHSREYGFILRYPEGKEHITGIDYEPWHFRYVGKEAAAIIMDNGLTLEEFVESISE
ncbi:MAG: M15 family metallopeptidase [Lachnospiraceae bacterium]|nr:M15 family metallopeptidase [Lachnospiraceae bacterium]